VPCTYASGVLPELEPLLEPELLVLDPELLLLELELELLVLDPELLLELELLVLDPELLLELLLEPPVPPAARSATNCMIHQLEGAWVEEAL
jgi:hypothetical protein